ncbi:MAG TPA: outer membrane beta-barrel protein [Bradyrhizobium sp.]|jgi:outer membrane immunogenic protein|nr:outer membrane beta-barrel protein [Bradyrhizobium sp.]
MKKLVLALSAVAAFSAPALAADMAAKAPLRPAPVAYAPSWTGCYVGGGWGYGMWNQENTGFADPTPNGRILVRTQETDTVTNGGRGWLGTVQGGCDYQFGLGTHQLVIGAFGDYDFANIHGRHDAFGEIVADEKLSSQWAVGGRIGWVALPSLMVFFSGGYTEANFDRQDYTNLTSPPFGIPANVFTDKRTYKGWFLGAGDEYALNFLPGLFWKTEYRVSEFNVQTNPFLSTTTGLPLGVSEDSKKWVQTVRSELVYRFNWGGPVVAKY